MANTQFRKPSEYPAPATEPKSSQQWTEFLRNLDQKLIETKTRLGELAAQRGESALSAELGVPNGLEKLTAERSELESRLEGLQLALESGRGRLRECERKEAVAQEDTRQQKIALLKVALVTAAEAFDQSAIQMKKSLDSFYRLTSDIDNLMTPVERQGFLGCRNSTGVENAMGFHKLARPLNMGIAARSLHHKSLTDFVSIWCRPATPTAPAPAPPRETLEWQDEATALSTARPRTNPS